MLLNDRINAFIELGNFINQFKTTGNKKVRSVLYNDDFFDEMSHRITSAVHYNGWFTEENVLFSLNEWSDALKKERLNQWISSYSLKETSPKTVGVIMAGNIPLVGFHDFLSVLIAGHKIMIKQSSDDNQLLPFLVAYLIKVEPRFEKYISFTNEKFEHFDAIIATGSDNTARYFEYYFGSVPNIIRKNRNSVAVLNGNESSEQLNALGQDIFRYYGLGCRNVSKLLIPKAYNFDNFFKAIYDYNTIINSAKYANNYDYNKAVYLMSNYKLFENGFLMLKEDQSYSSPIATLFYETYDSKTDLEKKLEADQEKIQCIVANDFLPEAVDFGQTQSPKLSDYADGIDIIEFLIKIS
ncbi:acyl-CoA reductase [Aquimarina gracilis]|uniref:Acyl-CoA reductase n=1 Tax=Aquimarina gracilis TaxID=874422 RepID=A0ABU6A1T3_9FLAO|nr:acyl-CoA reductase [Aquimarina gracilis]MEB3348086.1 acyl-CoA reductase [Aquimarina gracilis]